MFILFYRINLWFAFSIKLCLLLQREHSPLITSLHLAPSCASFSSCYHLYSLFSISSSSLSEHSSSRCFNCPLLGLSPCWFHWIACQVIKVLVFLNVSPNNRKEICKHLLIDMHCVCRVYKRFFFTGGVVASLFSI